MVLDFEREANTKRKNQEYWKGVRSAPGNFVKEKLSVAGNALWGAWNGIVQLFTGDAYAVDPVQRMCCFVSSKFVTCAT